MCLTIKNTLANKSNAGRNIIFYLLCSRWNSKANGKCFFPTRVRFCLLTIRYCGVDSVQFYFLRKQKQKYVHLYIVRRNETNETVSEMSVILKNKRRFFLFVANSRNSRTCADFSPPPVKTIASLALLMYLIENEGTLSFPPVNVFYKRQRKHTNLLLFFARCSLIVCIKCMHFIYRADSHWQVERNRRLFATRFLQNVYAVKFIKE